jgi:glutamate--cysteine ligase
MKTIYRRGLGYRYGRHMQTIAGIHFNYSLPEAFWPGYQAMLGDDGDAQSFRSAEYLGLVRNFRRYGWLVLYLFGASPAMCKSFGAGEDLDMPELSRDSWYAPFGTSLRMSDLGYNNQNQSRINISLNDLDHYIDDLNTAINTPEPDYEKIGVIVDGKYRQLSANQLQIENEYYSSVRPKRVAHSGERPTAALRRGGIEYVEIRSLDVSVDDPAGIGQNTMRFMEAFLIYCLLEDSPPFDDAALEETRTNQSRTAREGRDPACRLLRDGDGVLLADWGREILDKVEQVAAAIDRSEGENCYVQAVSGLAALIDDADKTPSARLLNELHQRGDSFFEYAISMARSHRDYFASITPLSEQRHEEFLQEAKLSLERQHEIEAADLISFEEYLAHYYANE